jgi:serine/threonine-protein kinase RsbT
VNNNWTSAYTAIARFAGNHTLASLARASHCDIPCDDMNALRRSDRSMRNAAEHTDERLVRAVRDGDVDAPNRSRDRTGVARRSETPGAAPACSDRGRVTRSITLDIHEECDRLWASGAARRFAAALGLSSDAQARLAVCVSEIASNIAKHATRGRIELTELEPPVSGCRVVAVDDGPGIAAITDALRDGFSEGRWLTPDVPRRERRGLGVGLGTVARLMNEVRLQHRPGGGLVIEAVLWRK